MASSTYISRTVASSGNRKTWTWSAWIKRANLTGAVNNLKQIFSESYADASNWANFYIEPAYSGDVFSYYEVSGYSWTWINFFRDPTAWYHIVLRTDTTEGDNADRMRLYINGVLATPEVVHSISADTDLDFNIAGTLYIGRRTSSAYGYFEGAMSHVQFVDGASLAPTEFGEVDSTSGMWKIKTGSYSTPGTNGYHLKMQDRSNLDLDSSSNAFTFTTTGNLTATYDNPSNNFCTLNPLDNYYPAMTFTNGDNTITTTGSKAYATGTFGLSAGLWYWEVKPTAQAGGNFSFIGIADVPATGTTTNFALGYTSTTWCYYSGDGKYRNSDTSTTYGDSYTTDDIVGVYLDLTANKLYFAKNGVIQNSGTGISITAPASTANGQYFPGTNYWDAGVATYQHNFGNGYFGTTAVTSAVADAGGIGAFEYDPSAGGASSFDGSAKDFRAITTKNIKAYGG